MVTLEQFSELCNVQMFDMDTRELIDWNVVKEHKKAVVLVFTVHHTGKLLVRYHKDGIEDNYECPI